MIKRVATGIPGLDRLMEGGLVENSVTLLTGETGTGKTIFASQYIYGGLLNNEPGMFITLEETPEDIKNDAAIFGWDFDKFEKKGLFKIIYHDPVQVNNIDSVIIGELNTLKAKRLVIDSTSLVALNIENPAQIRRRLFHIISSIKRNRTTAIVTSEIPEGSKALSRFGVEEFVVDGVVVLHYLGIGEVSARSLTIRKMRRTSHGNDVYPLEIAKSGLVVKKSEI
ncbi:MAG: ATPase [Candidatus Aenigmarchaeota archaeon]|nr:ATPase [Candidatus Aenigmarchaeota archaeon]